MKKETTTYIYAIQHNATKRMYIGKTKDVCKRYMDHIYKLRSNKHPSAEMQSDFNEYGEDYSVYVLEEIANGKEKGEIRANPRTKEREAELKWMIKYNTLETGYNTHDTPAKRMLIVNQRDVFPIKSGLPKVGDV